MHRDLDLRGAELVVLAPCESGASTGNLRRLERYRALDGAILAKGARGVISTLSEVDDAAALVFTASLHAALANGQTVAAAYGEATDALRSGRYRAITADDSVGRLLARTGVIWQQELAELDRQRLDLSDPYYWGVFKAAGLTLSRVQALAADD